MYKLEIEWNFKVYINAETAEEAKNIFADMSWQEVFEAGRENGIYEDYTIERAEV